jgi:predicted phage terminase large subunit-like protein
MEAPTDGEWLPAIVVGQAPEKPDANIQTTGNGTPPQLSNGTPEMTQKNKNPAPQELSELDKLMAGLAPSEQEQLLADVENYRKALEREKCQDSFMAYVKKMWPGFIHGRHHALLAKKFEDVAAGKIKRLAISLPPRHTKSEFGSYLFPSWFLGKFPGKKVMQASNTGELAVGFGRKVRNLVMSEQYAEIFPDVALRQDSKAAGRWSTNHDGEYFAIGVGGTMTGRGADIVIIDDPHTEGEAALAAHDPSVYDRSYEWYTSGPRQRLQPGGAIIIIATRWSERDLIGRALKDAAERGKVDEWEVVELPAIMPSGNPLWPEYWSLDLLEALREELPPSKWNAQYQQAPTGEEGAIIKRDWWQMWKKDEPPPCDFIIQAWDTAFTKNDRSDYSACSTWGVFYLNDDPSDPNIILLDCFQKRMEFPELKDKARSHYEEWQPDDCIIEAKASGAPLIQELNKQGGMFIRGYTPTRGKAGQSNDKISRLNVIAPIFQGGKVWAPETRWAQEMIEQMAAFPNAAHDDLVDTAVMAVTRFRQGGFLRLESDEREDIAGFRKARAYY